MEDQSATKMAGKHLLNIGIRDRPDSGGKAFRKAILVRNSGKGVLNGDKRAEEGKESSGP
jgi:hypothetical protein